MRLAAVFIPNGVLTYVFGENHKGYTLNLGGKYNYEFTEINNLPVLKEKLPNPNFIKGFWGSNLYLVSAIVGANGTGKTSILNVFRNRSFCFFIYENEKNDTYKIGDSTDNIFDIIYYSPFLNIQNHDYVNSNFKDVSKYELMLEDTEYENIELSAQLELHNSENLKRWIKFRQMSNIEFFLNYVALPVFNKINVKINFVGPRVHDTPYKFRPFFERFKVIKDEEEIAKFDKLRELNPITNEKKRPRLFGNKIKLELQIIERVIDKVQNILEMSGNKYLNEGYINNSYTPDSSDFKKNKDLKSAFYFFIDNAFIQLSKGSQKIFLPTREIKDLLELLLSHIPEKDVEIENWTELQISFKDALQLLDAYENFIISFKDNFSLDRKILLTFRPDKNLSSGEKGMYNLFSSLYDYQFKVDKQIFNEYNRYSTKDVANDNYLLLLDEADMGFHPQWKKKFVKSILMLFRIIFPNQKIQILFTTHDPLTLSDIPKSNIVFLDKDKNSKLTYVLPQDRKVSKRSFGANIHDLLADSFFLKDGFMGEFAEYKIGELLRNLNFLILGNEIEDLNNKGNKKNRELLKIKKAEFMRLESFVTSKDEDYIKSVIDIVDEPILKFKLEEMYDRAFPNNVDKKDALFRAKDILGRAGLDIDDLIDDVT
ncbi:hypothetical protein BTO05_10970 [Winogradskyella sp. PC-19]|uniref:AAA family ATPase n=1 Tax=Winogradskyella sp. PC-19 TaxID=754417 RepID=UPI000B3C7A5F|nr:AAA family ATPase [Winogradskyella sp. PC-19]ARV10132.1 hypothetical protein BTO05_10970 [Winogradskyella sp. PC-19]